MTTEGMSPQAVAQLLVEFENADWWMIELRDPANGNVTRVGFWGKDQQQEAVARSFELERELNDRLAPDETPFAAVVVPVFDRA